MNGFYVTYYGTTHIIEPTNDINLSSMDLIKLVIPEGIVSVRCWNNYLTELIIPNKVKFVHCWGNNLTKLDLPDSVELVECRNNNLTELIVPDYCIVECDPNVNIITRTMYNRYNRLKQILK